VTTFTDSAATAGVDDGADVDVDVDAAGVSTCEILAATGAEDEDDAVLDDDLEAAGEAATGAAAATGAGGAATVLRPFLAAAEVAAELEEAEVDELIFLMLLAEVLFKRNKRRNALVVEGL
jgi:hypothetical protein